MDSLTEHLTLQQRKPLGNERIGILVKGKQSYYEALVHQNRQFVTIFANNENGTKNPNNFVVRPIGIIECYYTIELPKVPINVQQKLC